MNFITKLFSKIPFRQLFFFGLSGIAGYVVDASITVVLKAHLGVYLARIPAFIAAATITWLINRNITFGKASSKHESLAREYIHYLSLMLFGMIVNYVAYALSITMMPDISHAVLICVAIGSLAGMIVNFFTSKKFIFNKQS